MIGVPATRLSVSVILATFNGAAYVDEQLRSLAAQTRAPDELIISDDGSTDGTLSIVEDFARRAPFPVEVVLNRSSNRGADQNFAAAISKGVGDLVFFCDQDDRWARDKIELMVREFEAEPEVGLVMCDASIVDEHLSPTGSTIWSRFHFGQALQEKVTEGQGFLVFSRTMPLYGCTMAVRRALAPHFLPVPSGVSFDAWIGQIISVVAEVRLVHHPLLEYRQHSAQVTGFDSGSRLRLLSLLLSRSDAESAIAESRRLELMLERLAELPATRGRGAARQVTTDRLLLMRRRVRVRNSTVLRIPLVLSGLIRGEYRRGAQGPRSAVVDLLSRRSRKT